jgi:hypothetical protein
MGTRNGSGEGGRAHEHGCRAADQHESRGGVRARSRGSSNQMPNEDMGAQRPAAEQQSSRAAAQQWRPSVSRRGLGVSRRTQSQSQASPGPRPDWLVHAVQRSARDATGRPASSVRRSMAASSSTSNQRPATSDQRPAPSGARDPSWTPSGRCQGRAMPEAPPTAHFRIAWAGHAVLGSVGEALG